MSNDASEPPKTLYGLIDRICREFFDSHPELKFFAAMDEEDFTQSVLVRLLQQPTRYFLYRHILNASLNELKYRTAQKRFSKKVEPMTQRTADDLGYGGPWDAAEYAAAKELLAQMRSPKDESRLTWEEARQAIDLLRKILEHMEAEKKGP